MSTTDPVADRSSPLDLAGAIVRGLADRLDVEISIEPTPAAAHVLDAAEREAERPLQRRVSPRGLTPEFSRRRSAGTKC